MKPSLLAKILNISSFVVLLAAVGIYFFAKSNQAGGMWIIVTLIGALLLRMFSMQVKNKELQKENKELKQDLKDLTRILREKTKE